jgi:hypothetical protein
MAGLLVIISAQPLLGKKPSPEISMLMILFLLSYQSATHEALTAKFKEVYRFVAPEQALQLMTIAFPESREGKCLTKSGKFELEALASTSLGPDWMVLAANAVEKKNGYPDTWHGCPGLLNLIWFKKVNGTWQQAGHEENIAELGIFGMLGKVNFHPLPDGRLAMSIVDGDVGNGEMWMRLNLFELLPEKSRRLTEQVGMVFSLIKPKRELSIDSKWCFAQVASSGSSTVHPDLVLQFEGTDWIYNGKGEETLCCGEGWKVVETINEKAVYAYSDGAYRLKSGSNPVDKWIR